MKVHSIIKLAATLFLLFYFSMVVIAQNRINTTDYFNAISNPAINTLDIPNYYNTFIQLSATDTVRHNTATHFNFTDPFLQLANSEKILPASRIYGFLQNQKYYRSASVRHRAFVFAKQIAKGQMSLYMAKNKLYNTAAELDMRGGDNYQNTMLIQDQRTSLSRYNNFYFINSVQDTTQLKLINPKNFADTYLRKSPKAYRLMKRYEGRGKLTEQILAGILFTSGISYLIMRDEANSYFAKIFNQDRVAPNNYIGGIFLGSAVMYLTWKIAFGQKKLTPERFKEVIDIYNNDVKHTLEK